MVPTHVSELYASIKVQVLGSLIASRNARRCEISAAASSACASLVVAKCFSFSESQVVVMG